MGLTNSEHTNATYIKLFAGKKDEKPYFGLKGGKDVNYKIISEHDTLDGFLKSIELSSFVYEGETKDTVKLTFTDNNNELMIVEGNLNTMIMKSIINTICGISDLLIVKIRMRVYLNKNGYSSVYITDSNGNRLNWKYSLEQLPKPIPYKTPSGKEEFDSLNVIAEYKKMIGDIQPKLSLLQPLSSQSVIKDVPSSVIPVDTNVVDDLPF